MKVIKHGVPLYERLKNVHDGFMKALEMRTSFFMRLWKCRITVYAGHKQRISFDEHLKKLHHNLRVCLPNKKKNHTTPPVNPWFLY